MLKKLFHNLMILTFVVQVGFLSGSFRAFGFVAEKDFLEKAYVSRNEANKIRVVFFEKEGDSLFPKCQISEKEYPGILPDFVKVSSNHSLSSSSHDLNGGLAFDDFAASDELSSAFHSQSTELSDLEACEQELSLELVAEAEYFELYPQVALAPAVGAAIIVATNLFSCGLGGIMGILGGLELAEEWKTDYRGNRYENFKRRDAEYLNYFPTRGEFITVAAPAAGSALSFTTTSAYTEILFGPESSQARAAKVRKRGKQLTKSFIKTGSRVAGVAGFVCGVTGGMIGYFMGSTDTYFFTDNK